MFIFAHFFIFSLFYSFYFLSLQGTSEQSCSSTHISLEKKEQLSWWQQLEQLNRQTYQDQAVDWQENNYIRYLERAFELRTKASPEARRALAAKVYVPIMQRPVIDKVTLENLDIVLGRQEPRHALVTAVNKTVSQLGFCALLH